MRYCMTLVVVVTVAVLVGTVPASAQEDEPPAWAGSLGVADSQTRFKIGGFARFDFMYDSDEIASRCEFVTATIATDQDDDTAAASGRTSYCINPTRLTLESRTPTKLGRLTTFVSVDFFGDLSSPRLRLRQAYGKIDGVLFGGDVLVGQAWSTFTDLDAWPDILDFEGPSSSIAARPPKFGWSKQFAGSAGIELAAEAPQGDIQGAEAMSRWPDFVGAVRWSYGRGYVKGAGVVRDVRAKFETGPALGALGWGLAVSGNLVLPALAGTRDTFLFEVSYGRGTGGYYDDAPPNAVYDPASGELQPLPLTAFYVGYDHGWTETLSSGILYAWLEVDNLASQGADALSASAYFSLNLIWRPDTPLMFGIEFLRGGRRDRDGAEGTDNRVQVSAQYSF